jgi:hypothetical protein
MLVRERRRKGHEAPGSSAGLPQVTPGSMLSGWVPAFASLAVRVVTALYGVPVPGTATSLPSTSASAGP